MELRGRGGTYKERKNCPVQNDKKIINSALKKKLKHLFPILTTNEGKTTVVGGRLELLKNGIYISFHKQPGRLSTLDWFEPSGFCQPIIR